MDNRHVKARAEEEEEDDHQQDGEGMSMARPHVNKQAGKKKKFNDKADLLATP
jgi:hypothetical protein